MAINSASAKYLQLYTAAIEAHGARCYYCGDDKPKRLGLDHVRASANGGESEPENLVPCCSVCNSIKGHRGIEQMRPRLVQKILGWPKFTIEQLAWLRAQGFDMSAYDAQKLWFEQSGAQPILD